MSSKKTPNSLTGTDNGVKKIIIQIILFISNKENKKYTTTGKIRTQPLSIFNIYEDEKIKIAVKKNIKIL
tara:strand:- start:239 stop:448 length:210 start_codon:yes stop_codon:yes gene_type:complete